MKTNYVVSNNCPDLIVSIDTEFTVFGGEKSLLRATIVTIKMVDLVETLNGGDKLEIEIHDFPMYRKEWHLHKLSSFWDKRMDQLVEYEGECQSYQDLCDCVHQKIKDLFQHYREISKSSIKIIMGTTNDAETIKSISPNGDIFYVKQAYSDPIIVRSIFSMYAKTEGENPYNTFYKHNKWKKRMRDRLHLMLVGSSKADAHNPQYDAILNAINFIAVSGYINKN